MAPQTCKIRKLDLHEDRQELLTAAAAKQKGLISSSGIVVPQWQG
jgi:hypothetical protein